ncbi:MAG: glycosyltransferase [Lachnospiraceae bacterium]|nr:glycosyltransferase [Lachnospiraceae bacterium]
MNLHFDSMKNKREDTKNMNMGNIKISIIIPTYNGVDNIETAVQSALLQTFSDTEIIVVDDNGLGSNGQIATEQRLKKYIEQQRIIYICHESNKGGSAARNTGAKNSTGKYIAFLDDDDVLLPQMIEKQVEKLEEADNSVGMSVCSGYYVHYNGVGYCRYLIDSRNMLFDYLLDKQYFNTSTIVVRKAVFDELSGFDESFIRHQDWEFCVRLLSRYSANIVREPLIIRYMSVGRSSRKCDDLVQYLDYFFEKMDNVFKKSLAENDYARVKLYKYSELAVGQYIERKFIEGFKVLLNRGFGIKGILFSMLGLWKRVFNKLIRGRKKRCASYKETMDKLNSQEAEIL